MREDELVVAGVYDPAAPDAPERLALIQYLLSLGATIEDLQREVDELPIVAFNLALWPNRERLTLQEAADRIGVTEEFVADLLRTVGIAAPEPGDRALPSQTVELFSMFNQGMVFLGAESTRQIGRVLGASAARIADALVSVFVVTAGRDAYERDESGLALAEANAAAGTMLPILAQGFDVLLRHHLEIARRPITALQAAGVETQRRTIGFVDIVGSTALAERVDAVQLAAAIDEFDGVTADTVTALGGRVVKLMGDGAMFVAASPIVAVTIGLALAEAFGGHEVLPSVRVALATGDVVARDGDFYGSVVNRAARALAQADPASVVVDRATADALGEGAFTLVDRGPFELKGFAEPTQLFAVTRGAVPPA